MTTDEAIKVLEQMKADCDDRFHKVRYVTKEEALGMAIDAIDTLDIIRIFTKDDAVSAAMKYRAICELVKGGEA